METVGGIDQSTSFFQYYIGFLWIIDNVYGRNLLNELGMVREFLLNVIIVRQEIGKPNSRLSLKIVLSTMINEFNSSSIYEICLCLLQSVF